MTPQDKGRALLDVAYQFKGSLGSSEGWGIKMMPSRILSAPLMLESLAS